MTARSTARAGILLGLAAYGWWGFLPAYIKLLHPVPAPDILAHRVLWSLALMALLALAMRRGAQLRALLARPRLLAALAASALLIGGNWLVYIYAVNAGHVLQASLGYFINPLVNVALGVAVLRERLGRPEALAVGLAALGVAIMAFSQPLVLLGIPLSLAISFGLYGLVRKMTPIEPIEGLLVETAILAPPALAWLVTSAHIPAGASPYIHPLLALAGVVTAVPLLLFAAAAHRVQLSLLGLLQYIAPTLQFLLAVAAFGEPLEPLQLVTFAFIWSGLAVYAVAGWQRSRAAVPPPE